MATKTRTRIPASAASVEEKIEKNVRPMLPA
jgi:hypothetical protein